MHLFLVRHAHADPGEPDEQRPLSERGRGEATALANELSEHATPPTIVLSSPLIRARETADEIARAVGAEVAVDERLAPGATVAALRSLLRGRSGPAAVVGHQPDCSEIAVALTGRDPGFAPGGYTQLALDD